MSLLRFTGASRRDEAVQKWLSGEPAELRAMARHWFVHMRRCGDDVLELFHDGCPVVCFGDAPFAYVNTFAKHVNVGFFQGAALDDPERVLLGQGKFMRHVKLIPGKPVPEAALLCLIDAAYADIRTRLGKSLETGDGVCVRSEAVCGGHAW